MANLANLDGIRAIAVSLVVLSHLLLQMSVGDPSVYSIKAMGRIGVAIFFVHTTLVLLASLDRHRSSAISFYVRRVFRIYPLSVAVVLLFALIYKLGNIPIEWHRVITNLLLVQNITDEVSIPLALWTLPFEMQMYLVLPALVFIASSRHGASWIALLLALSVLFILSLQPESMAWKVLRFIPSFLPGALAFALSQRINATKSPAVLFGLVLVTSVLIIPMLVAAGVPELPLMWVLCAAIGLAIPLCRQIPNGFPARVSKTIAKYSYGIYLTHGLAVAMVSGPHDGMPAVQYIAQWIAMIILLPSMAYVSYHCIEKHGVALGARLADNIDASRGRNSPVTSLPSPGNGSG